MSDYLTLRLSHLLPLRSDRLNNIRNGLFAIFTGRNRPYYETLYPDYRFHSFIY